MRDQGRNSKWDPKISGSKVGPFLFLRPVGVVRFYTTYLYISLLVVDKYPYRTMCLLPLLLPGVDSK